MRQPIMTYSIPHRLPVARFVLTLICLFLLGYFGLTAQSATTGEFEYYFYDKDKKVEQHTIFAPESNVTRLLEGHDEVTHTFHFTPYYDTLFQQSPEEFEWNVSLPDGAYFDPNRRFLYWKMRSDQLEDYLIKIRVRHRGVSDSAVVALRVAEKWKSALIPGASYSLYVPYNPTAYGTFNGVAVEYLLAAWVSRTEARGPSHGKVYVRFDLMSSSDPDVSESFFYTAGLNLSLERNPRRLFAIPYFGIELGGMYNAQWESNIFQFTPVAGVWVYADQTNTISLTGGYLIPSDQFETLRGWRASVGGTFSLW
jgi:hypothetical protein